MRTIHTLAWLLTGSLLLSACQGGRDSTPFRTAERPIQEVLDSSRRVDQVLLDWLASAGENDTIEVIVAFHGRSAPSAAQLARLDALGLTGLHLRYLPIAGVVSNPAQLRALMGEPEVRSLWHNAELTYDDDVARYMTSVDQARQQPELVNADGQPITGQGVTILVNDSGIDGTHLDLLYGDKVLANALGHTNLRNRSSVAPYSPTEGVPNTDLLGSHGSHVASIAAGLGSHSDGRYAGAAIGASLAGYGSGATLLVLDSLGGFDYALHLLDTRPELNLRIVTNSFGSTSDQATRFNPDHPTNIVTKILSDAGLVIVFSAGNSGSGPDSITGNYKKAPWVLLAANGTKDGLLADSSSRGAILDGVYRVRVDGELFTIEDRPLVVTPGTDYIGARATAAEPTTPLDLYADQQQGEIPPEQLPFYTHKTGTSMAAPHLAGLVALLLEANPALTWRELKDIFKATATNMPGYEPWEVGAGYANVEAALAMALALRDDYGQTTHLLNPPNAYIPLTGSTVDSYSVDFMPAGESGAVSFEVGEDIALLVAAWNFDTTNPCSCAIVLVDPDGNQHGSGIALPTLSPRVSTAAPGKPGTWQLTARGIGSVSGVTLDPLGLSNGVSPPATLNNITVELFTGGDAVGLDDAVGHPAESYIRKAVAERLMDAREAGFLPDAALLRGEFARYLGAWGLRQTRAHDGSAPFADLSGPEAAAAAASVRTGQLIMDRSTTSRALIEDSNAGSFRPQGTVSRQLAAYALVQATGGQAAAEQYDGPLMAYGADGDLVELADAEEIEAALRGHVQHALLQRIVEAEIVDGQAYFRPQAGMSRADFAIASVKTFATVPFPF